MYENRCLTAHGGLMIYIHDEFHYRNLNRDIEITNTSDLFESLIVEILRGRKVLPPNLKFIYNNN